MKKFFGLFLLLLAYEAHGQPILKGSKFIGGTTRISFSGPYDSGNGSNKSTEFGIGPTAGLFLSEHWAIGLGAGWQKSTIEFNGSPSGVNLSNISSGYTATCFGSWFVPVTEKFYFKLQNSLDFNRQTSKTESSISVSSTEKYSLSLNARPAFVFFPSDHWGVELGFGALSYAHNQNLSTGDSGNSFGFYLTSSIGLGLYYYFGFTK